MKILSKLFVFTVAISTVNSAPFVDFIGDLLAGKIKVVSPAEYFAPSDNPPSPGYHLPDTTTTTTTTTTAAPKLLFAPSYDPPAPSYDVPPPADNYELPGPPGDDDYDYGSPFKAGYQVINNFCILLYNKILKSLTYIKLFCFQISTKKENF